MIDKIIMILLNLGAMIYVFLNHFHWALTTLFMVILMIWLSYWIGEFLNNKPTQKEA